MIMKKIMVKFLMVMLVLVVTILPGCAKNYNGIDVFHNGKGNIIITVKSESSSEEFNSLLNDFIDGLKLMSGYTDIVTVKSVEKTENGYIVDAKLRRIDKIVLNGAIERKKFSQFARFGSQDRALIEKLNKGNIACTMPAYYQKRLGQIQITRTTIHKVSPKTPDGKDVNIEEFLTYGEKSSGRNMFINFRLFDIDGVESIKVKLPGEVKYIGGNNIKVVGKDEIEVTKCNLKIQTITNIAEKDENGVEVINPVVGKKDANSFVGYVVYDKSLSPFEITVITIAVIVGVSIITAILLYFIILGKKELAKGGNLR